MWTLLWIGLLGGAVAGVSPCILPVLPALLAGSAAAGSDGSAPGGRRPVLVVAGLVTSFALVVLLGSVVLSALHLPAALLRWLGIGALALVGLSLLIRPLEEVLARPFRRIPGITGRSGGGFLLGVALGTLYVPCAGPVLAAVALAGTSGHITGRIVWLTAAFALGTAIPLLVLATAGQQLGRRWTGLRRRSTGLRRAAGVVLVAIAVATAFDLTDPLTRTVPTYTQALQNAVEDNAGARVALAGARGDSPSTTPTAASPVAVPPTVASPAIESPAAVVSSPAPTPTTGGDQPAAAATGPVAACQAGAAVLANCGTVAEPTGITRWFNTADNRPVSLQSLRGSVVIVDFWAFSCINCQHVQPYLNRWYQAYRDAGLVVVGVHTPEFSFEKDPTQLRQAISDQQIRYPVAMDDQGATWSAFHNVYWPAQYLLDASGTLRHTQFGEGGYVTGEKLIRSLLLAAHPGQTLPAPTQTLS